MDPTALALRRNLRRALQGNDVEEAQRVLERLRERDPLGVETQAFELELHLRCGRHAEAQALARQLVERFPDSARVHYLAGRLAYLRKDYARAERLLEESQRLEPHWWTERLLGKAYTQSGRLDEAESVLLRLVDRRSVCLKDLAWLYERKQELDRAAEYLERYAKAHPRDPGTAANLRRLRATALEPQEMVAEVERMLDLKLEVPLNLWPAYAEAALRLGQRDTVAELLAERAGDWDPRTLTSVAWNCYRLQAHDLACEAFCRVLPDQLGNVKLLTALEAAASRSGKLDELIAVYRTHVREARHLYGRIRRLERRRDSS